MKSILLTSLAGLALACSSQETRCRELSVELERIGTEMERVRPGYCQAASILLYAECGGNKEKFVELQVKYAQLRDTHYEECNQVQF